MDLLGCLAGCDILDGRRTRGSYLEMEIRCWSRQMESNDISDAKNQPCETNSMTDSISISAENLAFYEMGMRLQQAITLHDYALGWCSDGDSSFGKMFTSSIERMRGVSRLLPLERSSLDATRDLIAEVYFSWENLRNSKTRRSSKKNKSFLNVDESSIKFDLGSLKKHLLFCTDYNLEKLSQCELCLRLGMAIVDGTGNMDDWCWENQDELDQLMDVCGLKGIDVLFPGIDSHQASDPYGPEFSYPADRFGWYRAEAGLRLLKRYQSSSLQTDVSSMDANENVVESITDDTSPAKTLATGKKRWKLDEANIMVREFLSKNSTATRRSIFEATGISEGTISNTAAWKAVAEKRKTGKKPKFVSLTDQLLHTQGQADAKLKQLIEEQEKDHDPSPFEDGRNPRQYPGR